MQDRFSAHTKYNDYRGSASADSYDTYSLSSLPQEKKFLADGEHIVGINVVSGNPTPGNITKVGACAYLVGKDVTDEQITAALNRGDVSVLKIVEVSISPSKFFSLFKRFDLVFSKGGTLNGLPLHYKAAPEG